MVNLECKCPSEGPGLSSIFKDTTRFDYSLYCNPLQRIRHITSGRDTNKGK